MGPWAAIRRCLVNPFLTDARAGRPEFWWFFLFALVAQGALVALDLALFKAGFARFDPYETINDAPVLTGGPLTTFGGIFLTIAIAAAGMRRLHDTGRRGAWMLLGLLPVVGWIPLAVLLARRGNPEPNVYGPSPAP
ncbi:MAG: DUF805 domain-containing protein [Hyphomicrobiales bacterium]